MIYHKKYENFTLDDQIEINFVHESYGGYNSSLKD